MSETLVQPIISHAVTRPHVTPETHQASTKGVTLVSIFPGDLRKQCRHNGTIEYVLLAAPRGSYSSLTVYDTQQWIRFASESGPRYDQWGPGPIPAQIVAQDLVLTWAGSFLKPKNAKGMTIGVDIIKADKPEPGELAKLNHNQDSLFNAFIMEANSLHIAGKGVDITDIHRTAAKYLLDEGASQLPWFPVVLFADVKQCMSCSRKILAAALRCEHCHEFLPDLYMKYGLMAEGDKAVSDFMKKATKGKSGSAPLLDLKDLK